MNPIEFPRILVPVSNPLGGIRTYLLYNLRRLHDSGFRFTFLSAAGSVFESFKKDLADWDDTQFVDVPAEGGAKTTFFSIRRTLKKGRIELIHSQGLQAGAIASAANYSIALSGGSMRPHLVTLHDVIVPGNDIPGRFKSLKKAIVSVAMRKGASVLIPVTDDCRRNHLDLFPAWKTGTPQIETIVNGVDADGLLASRARFEAKGTLSLRKDHGLEPDVMLGGFFGRFMPQKGFDILLNALHILVEKGYQERFRLVATKDLNGYLHETIVAASQHSEVEKMVRFIDPVSDIAPLLCQTDLLVMPSRWEACGLLAMEAMILGKPVVGSNCIGLREVLDGTPSLVFETENPESLAERLIESIEGPAKQAAEDYAPAAAERFDVKRATDKLLQLYRRFG